jgi:hypothetical protein
MFEDFVGGSEFQIATQIILKFLSIKKEEGHD